MNAQEVIERYAAGAEKVAQAVRGLTAEDMAAVPDPGANVGKWSIQQLVVHVADAEFAFADRVKRIIAEDDPVLLAWDENKFAASLSYDTQSAADAVELIKLIRLQTTRILRAAPASAFARKGRHTERGPQTVIDVLNYAVPHLDHHVKFIHDKRAYMGKEMW